MESFITILWHRLQRCHGQTCAYGTHENWNRHRIMNALLKQKKKRGINTAKKLRISSGNLFDGCVGKRTLIQTSSTTCLLKNFKLKFVIINVVFGGWEFYFQIYNFVLPQQHSYKVDRGKSNISYMVAKIGFLYSV